MNCFETVIWRRRRSEVSGSVESRRSAGASAGGAFEDVSPRRNGSARGSSVTTSRRGITVAGQIATATALASCFDRWKNCGMTSALFSGVMTLASWTTLVMQSFPARSGSASSGNRWMRWAATFR